MFRSPLPAPSSFVDFINGNQQTKQKIFNNLTSKSDSNAGALSRAFKNLPVMPTKLIDLAACFAEAYRNDEKEFWFNLLAAYINTDLFDSEGHLKPELTQKFIELVGTKHWAHLTLGLSRKDIAKIFMEAYISELTAAINKQLGNSIDLNKGTFNAFTVEQQLQILSNIEAHLIKQQKKKNDPESEEPMLDMINEFRADTTKFQIFLGILNKTFVLEMFDQLNGILNLNNDLIDSIQSINKVLQAFQKDQQSFKTEPLKTLVERQLESYKSDDLGLPSIAASPEIDSEEVEETTFSDRQDLERLYREIEVSKEKNTILTAKVAKIEYDNQTNAKTIAELSAKLEAAEKTNAQLHADLQQKQTEIEEQKRQHALIPKDSVAGQEIAKLQQELADLKAKLDATIDGYEDKITDAEVAKLKLRLSNESAKESLNIERAGRKQSDINAANAEKAAQQAQKQAAADRVALEQANARAARAEKDAQEARAQAEDEKAGRNQAQVNLLHFREMYEVACNDMLNRVKPEELYAIGQKNLALEPKVAKALECINQYQAHLMKAITKELPEQNVLVEGERFAQNSNAESSSPLSYSVKKAIIKYHSCEKLKNILSNNQKNAYQKALSFGVEIINNKHVRKLEMSRTHPLWDVVKGLLMPFTFIYSIVKKESDFFKHESQAGKNLLTAVTDLYRPIREEAIEFNANHLRGPANRS